MDEKELSTLSPFILAQLIEDMGGIVELDAEEVFEAIKEKKFKKMGLIIQEGRLIIEVFDEN